MLKLITGVLLMAAIGASSEVHFATQDGGVVYADLYGAGARGLVLAHGARFNKGSWNKEATELAGAGFRVVAIDFRGYGKSHGGPNAKAGSDDMYMDVLAAVRYLRENGATSVAVIGASMGGGASANAVVQGKPGEIDRLVLLSPAPIQAPERITGPKLVITSADDPITPKVREQYAKAPEPKELQVLEGAAHAQFLFTTGHREHVMAEILKFLGGRSSTAAR
jgi:alpha-beta hydrolase superfamily lysophospholipase